MDNIAPTNRATYWSAHVAQELYALGLRRAIISPGSRSTPLTLAFAAHPNIATTPILDERSAGFTALGIGKATGIPAVLVCTSGTAAANYYPAVIEARQSGVPLLVLTADRPPNHRNAGANQAIDQLKLYSDYPVFFHEMGEPVVQETDLQRLRMAADQAWSTSIEQGGPAHLNFPFRKPLEPDPDFIQQVIDQLYQTEKKAPQTTTGALHQPIRKSWPDDITDTINHSEHPLIIAGPANPFTDQTPAELLIDQLEAPVLAETGSNLRINEDLRIDGFDGFLRWKKQDNIPDPDLVIRFGEQPVGKALNQFMNKLKDIPQFWIGNSNRWHNSNFTVTIRLPYPDQSTIANIQPAESLPWLDNWKKRAADFSEYRSAAVDTVSELTDGHVVQFLTSQLPENWNLFLSNSFPVRDADLFGNFQQPPARCFVNRGASGIDGITSTAIGGSLATGTPGLLLIGDLAFLHDQNALLNSRNLSSPLVMAVLNNGGGTIFRKLPIAGHTDYFTEYFETPQAINIKDIAKANNLEYHRFGSPDQLKSFNLDDFASESGIILIECVTGADASMQLRETLWNQT